MRPEPKRIDHLFNQLPLGQRLPSIAHGLELLAENVRTLDADFATLESMKRRRSSVIVRGFADEEAAKAMVLLDAIPAGLSNHTTLIRAVQTNESDERIVGNLRPTTDHDGRTQRTLTVNYEHQR